MSLTLKANGESSFTPVPVGMHLAMCYRVIDLGTQKTEYKGETRYVPKVMLQFEVHGEDEDGKPLVTAKGEPLSISKNYSAYLSDKATLRKDLKNWRKIDFTPEELKGFKIQNVLGKWAMITVIKAPGRDGKEYTNISEIGPVPPQIKNAGLPKGFNKLDHFDFDNPDMAVFESISENIKNKIKTSPEWEQWQGSSEQKPSEPKSSASFDTDGLDDDIPF